MWRVVGMGAPSANGDGAREGAGNEGEPPVADAPAVSEEPQREQEGGDRDGAPSPTPAADAATAANGEGQPQLPSVEKAVAEEMAEAPKPRRRRWLRRFSLFVDRSLSDTFAWMGEFCCTRRGAIVVSALAILVTLGLGAGFSRFERERNAYKLFTPQDTEGQDDKVWVEETFGYSDEITRIYAVSSSLKSYGGTGSNSTILTRAAVLELCALWREMAWQEADTDEAGEVRWESAPVCSRPLEGSAEDSGGGGGDLAAPANTTFSTPCDVVSLLDFFEAHRTDPYNCDALAAEATNDTAVVAAVNVANATDKLGRSLDPAYVLGGLRYSSDNASAIVYAEAIQLVAAAQNNVVQRSGEADADPVVADWELAAGKYAVPSFESVRNRPNGSFAYETLVAYPDNDALADDEISAAFNEDVFRIAIAAVLLVIFSTFVLSRRSPVYSAGYMGLISTLCVGMAIVSSFGLMLWIGVTYSDVVQTGIILLLGLGLDDTFVILGEHWRQSENDGLWATTVPKFVRRVMRSAGPSITVTSLSDAAAFGTGAISTLPALRDFGLYTMAGVLFDFLYQCTFFVVFVGLDTRRRKGRRSDWLCCFKRTDPEEPVCCKSTPVTPGEPGWTDYLPGRWIASIALSRIGKLITMAGALALLGVSIYGATRVETNFEYENFFVPDGSYVKAAYSIRDAYFNGNVLQLGAYTRASGTQLIFNNRDELLELPAAMRANEWVMSEPQVVGFYEAMVEYYAGVNASDPNAVYAEVYEDNSTVWLDSMLAFLDSDAGADYVNDVAFVNGTNRTKISGTRVRMFARLPGNSAGNIDMMDSVRATAKAAAPDLDGTAYSFAFLFFEGDKVIKSETLRNVFIAAAAVFVMCLILLADVWTAILVLVMILAIDTELLGFMAADGLTYNSVTSISLILSLGLSVDYSVHIAHSFLMFTGTRDERSAASLRHIGGPVFQGAASTFLAILSLAGASSYVFKTFFKMWLVIISLGWIHGSIVLPVMLSWVGSRPYDDATPAAEVYPQMLRPWGGRAFRKGEISAAAAADVAKAQEEGGPPDGGAGQREAAGGSADGGGEPEEGGSQDAGAGWEEAAATVPPPPVPPPASP